MRVDNIISMYSVHRMDFMDSNSWLSDYISYGPESGIQLKYNTRERLKPFYPLPFIPPARGGKLAGGGDLDCSASFSL
jgi:hypothetical protein